LQLLLPRLAAAFFAGHQVFERRHFLGTLQRRDVPCQPGPRVVFIAVSLECGGNFARQFARRDGPEARGLKAKLTPIGVERFPLPARFCYVGRGSSDFASGAGNAKVIASVTFSMATAVPASWAIEPASFRLISG